MRSRFLKHSDVQIILQRLGLPLIDLAYGQPLQTIEEDDHESEHVVVPVEVLDVDAEPSVSTESTEQQFGVQLVAAAAAGDPGHGPGGGGGGDSVLCRVERMPKNNWGLGRLPQKDLCVMTETDFRNMTHARAAGVGAQACKSLAKATNSCFGTVAQAQETSFGTGDQDKQANETCAGFAVATATIIIIA